MAMVDAEAARERGNGLFKTGEFASAKEAHIGVIMPHTSLGRELLGDTWKQCTCAAVLAVRHVNARHEAVVPGLAALTANLTRLNGSVYDTGYSASPAIVSYRELRVRAWDERFGRW